jgi:LPXTG-motif cell wall-anchored protein
MKKNNNVLYAIIAVSVILLIGGGVFLFMKKKKCDDSVDKIKKLIKGAKDPADPFPCADPCAANCFLNSLGKDGKSIDENKLCSCLKKCDLSKCDSDVKKTLQDWLNCDCKDLKEIMTEPNLNVQQLAALLAGLGK